MPGTTLMMQSVASRIWKAGKPWVESFHPTSNYYFTATQDGPTIIKYFRNLYIPQNITVSTSVRNKGLVLFIDGDATINGTLTMTSRGAYASGANLSIDYKNADLLVNSPKYASYSYNIYKDGGSGGPSVSRSNNGYVHGITGTNGSNYSCGGGGSGAVARGFDGKAYSGSGSAGTSYSGGSGGGGCAFRGLPSATSGSGVVNCGPGGNAYASTTDVNTNPTVAGGGAGNNAGSGAAQGISGYSTAATNGTGGLLILVVRGSLIIGSTGIISSNGSPGGGAFGGNGTNFGLHASGGGSGGGTITLLYSKKFINSGSVTVNGGLGGTSSGALYNGIGGNGGVGSIRISKVFI